MRKGIFLLILLISFFSCSEKKPAQTNQAPLSRQLPSLPVFNADSAYQFVKDQLAFGPRVPNTPQHDACAEYLAAKMKDYGAEVIVQKGKVKAFDQTELNIRNIIAQFDVSNPNRILLFAHWDTRPFADHDEDPTRKDEPILGASDGASGVAVLMEVARNLQQMPTKYGIDIIFFDAEDYGTPDHRDLPYNPDTWCLGSQYWGKNLHKLGYYPKYGILLDMVGAKGAMFYQEQFSLQFAPGLVTKVWQTAEELGYGNYFPKAKGGLITDDHLYVNKLTGIPCINIIQHDPTSKTGFGTYWHTHNDNLDIIDSFTLGMVGKVLTRVIYYEGS